MKLHTRIPAQVTGLIARVLDKPTNGGGPITLSLPGAGEYASRRWTVPGWFELTDFYLFDFILGRQLNESVTGHLLEIGPYQGKSTILLGYGLREGEDLVVCDLFGLGSCQMGALREGMHDYDGLTVDQFYSNYNRYHTRRPRVEICASSDLPDRINNMMFRYIHIDGSHAYESVKSDIDLAIGQSSQGAVIVLDDYRSFHTPGVAAAVWEAVMEGLLYPFCISELKLYAVLSADQQKNWFNATSQFAKNNCGWESEVHVVRGREIIRMEYVTWAQGVVPTLRGY